MPSSCRPRPNRAGDHRRSRVRRALLGPQDQDRGPRTRTKTADLDRDGVRPRHTRSCNSRTARFGKVHTTPANSERQFWSGLRACAADDARPRLELVEAPSDAAASSTRTSTSTSTSTERKPDERLRSQSRSLSQSYGTNTIFPTVSRCSIARCASATSSNRYVFARTTFTLPSTTHPASSAMAGAHRATSSINEVR